MEILEKIFGSEGKVKIMKLFIFNPATTFDLKTISKKTKVNLVKTKSEVFGFNKIGLLRKKEIKNSSGRKVVGFSLNSSFKYIEALRNFLLQVSPITNEEMTKRLGKAGRLKLVVVSGVFIHEWESRVDMLIVGDRLKRNILEKTMREVEADLGKEIQYASLETPDFNYRMGVGDKLIRDVFDYPHKVVFDKIGIVQG